MVVRQLVFTEDPKLPSCARERVAVRWTGLKSRRTGCSRDAAESGNRRSVHRVGAVPELLTPKASQDRKIGATGGQDGTRAKALVRRHHPAWACSWPTPLLPLAETHGLLDSITCEVLAQQVQCRPSGRDVQVSVNLSAGTLLDAWLPQSVEDLLTRYQVAATSLVLEVTEAALLREPERSLAVVEAVSWPGSPTKGTPVKNRHVYGPFALHLQKDSSRRCRLDRPSDLPLIFV